MPLSNFIDKIRDRIHIWSTPRMEEISSQDPVVSVSGSGVPQQKQQQLEMLCAKLFEKRDLIASGKIQLLGLTRVRERIGQSRWPAMKDAIYKICDDCIKAHSDHGDLYVRFNDESYMVIFAKASPEESARKMALIAEDIRRRLFEEEGIEDIEILSVAKPMRRESLDHNVLFTGYMTAIEKDQQKQAPALKVVEVAVHQKPKTKIKSPFADLGIRLEESPRVQYIPVWDQAKKRLVAHMCLARNDQEHMPIEAHWSYYATASVSEKVKLDLAVLAQVIMWMREHPEKIDRFGIICPVHYDTILGGQGAKRYESLCQMIEPEMRSLLLFMVLDLPPSTPWFVLSKMIAPLKAHSREMCAQLSQYEQADFTALRQAGFDNVGIVMSPIVLGKRPSIRSFMARANRHPTMKTFILGIDDPFTVAEAVSAGSRYLGGQAIHEAIADPSEKPDFGKYLYSWMDSKASSRV